MKKSLRIITAVVICALTVCALLSFSGCKSKVDIGEAREALATSLDAARASETYYVKYRQNDNSNANGSYTQYSLNVQNATDESNLKAKFTIAKGDIIKTTYEDYFFGEAKGLEGKKVFVCKKDGKNVYEECTASEFLTKDIIAPYNITGVTGLLYGLGEQDLEIISAEKMGKVYYLTAKVLASDNILSAYDQINIRITNGKLSYIGDKGESLVIDIAYGGPKFEIPAYNA